MSAHDLLVDSFPHGTVEGFELGCRTNHCPAPIPCHVFRTRYVGDFGFRKRVDAGWTVEAIAEAEAAEARAAVEAERAERRAQLARKRKPKSLKPKRVPRPAKPKAERAPRIAVPTHGTMSGYSNLKCRGDDCPASPTCLETARAYWRARAEARRRRDGIEPQHTEAEYDEARRLHATGEISLTEIGKRLNMSRRTVAKVVGSTGQRPSVTACINGHKFTPENTYVRGNGNRNCKICRREIQRVRRAAIAAGMTVAEYRKKVAA